MDGGLARLCRWAGLPKAGWHRLRHSFGTHAALLGVNPWRLQTWMGHKSIVTTMGYVKLAEAHRRPVPPEILAAGVGEADPDRRIVLMLGARARIPANRLTTEPNLVRNSAE